MADHGLVVTCEFAESPAAISLNMASAVPPVLPLLAWQPWGCRIVPHDEPALEARDALIMCKVSAYAESQSFLANGSLWIAVVVVVAARDRVAHVVGTALHRLPAVTVAGVVQVRPLMSSSMSAMASHAMLTSGGR